jgi:hypothetical protein
MRAAIRLLTAITIIGICAFSVARGWSIAHFSLALMSIDSLEKGADALHPWTFVPGVASAALKAELRAKIDASAPKATNSRREALAAILSIEPLSSVNWLSLSGMQLITDQPMEQVLESLELSMVTGPNEGYVMADRGIFGFSLWERLPPELKRRVAVDLADLAAGAIRWNKKFQAILSTKSEGVRNELRAALLATGLLPREVERRLGF